MKLRINYLLPLSWANGPGPRFVVWVQGCSIHCKGCCNVDTWDPKLGYDISIDSIIDEIKNRQIEGITISGGEPLDQFDAVYDFCSKCLENLPDLTIYLCTGYTFDQLMHKGYLKIFGVLDAICLGPYEEENRCKNEWKGSSNQDILMLSERGEAQFKKYPVVAKEIHVGTDGTSLITGFSV